MCGHCEQERDEALAAIESEGMERVALEAEVERLRGVLTIITKAPQHAAKYAMAALDAESAFTIKLIADLKVHPAGSPGNPPFTQPMDDPPDTRDGG